MKLDKISLNQLENTQDIIGKVYDEHLTKLIQIDNKSNSLLNMSVITLTIQITVIIGVLFNVPLNEDINLNIILLIGILLFMINLFFNVLSLINFKNASQMLITSHPFDIIELTANLEENLNHKQQIMKNIFKYVNAIINNDRIIENKTTYINNGLKNLLISLIILSISIVILTLIRWCM